VFAHVRLLTSVYYFLCPRRRQLAATLLQRLQDYHLNRAEAKRIAEAAQRELDERRHAHLAAMDSQLSDILSFGTTGGRALLSAANLADPSNNLSGRSSGIGATLGTHSQSPTWRSRLISPTVAAAANTHHTSHAHHAHSHELERSNSGNSIMLSPSRMAASLRNGIFPTSSLMQRGDSDYGASAAGSSRELHGSSFLQDGTEVRHRIRLVDGSSSDEEGRDSEEESGDPRLQDLYRRANASHLAQYNGANSVHALAMASGGSSSGAYGSGAFGGMANSFGNALQRMGLQRAQSGGITTTSGNQSGYHTNHDTSGVRNAFHRALHPEHSDDSESNEDWGRALAELEDDNYSTRSRRVGFNGVSTSTRSNGASSSAGVNVGTLNAVAQTALQHDIARVSAAPHAPTLSSLSERLTTTNTSNGSAAPVGASEASSSGRGVNGDVLERLDRVANRPSAVDRYMALNPQQLYGTSASTTAGTGSSAGSSAGVGIETTFQVRATGNGGYTTVAVDSGNTATHPAEGSS
jgi:hypothetical protein